MSRTSHLDLPPLAHAAGTVALPGSKSISNRTLLLAALANGDTTIRGLLDADDIDRMKDALAALGIRVQRAGAADHYSVAGCGGVIPAKRAELALGNAGTAFRPLTAVLALAGGQYALDGVTRMRERPIGDLVDALRALGATIEYGGRAGYPPLVIHAPSASPAGEQPHASVRGEVSSQFLSALLMAAPILAARSGAEVVIDVEGELISKPYVALTIGLMRRFGVIVAQDGWRSFRIPARAAYASPGAIEVEGDASSASYFLAAGAIGGGPVRVTGVGRDSLQGDVEFAAALAKMGAQLEIGERWIEARRGTALHGIALDCTAIPDAAMTLAVVALFASGATTLTGIASWRVKETDRIAAMATELAKLGARVDAGPDRITVHPPVRIAQAAIDTYDDHRMAMCFSLAAFGGAPIRINDPDCVRKTFPAYFDVLRAIATPAGGNPG